MPILLAITNLVITVLASPINDSERIERDGAEVVTLTSGQLNRLGAQDLQTALRQVPGVTISRYGAIGSFGGGQGGSVYIRGMGAGRPGGEITTYQDGVPRKSGVWSHPLMDSIPMDFIEQVDVYKNPQPGRFSDTFGAIDAKSKRMHEDGYTAEAQIAAGRFNTLLTSGEGGIKDGAIDAYGGIAYKHSDGKRNHSAANMKNAYAQIGADLSEFERIAFIYQNTISSVEDPGDIRKMNPDLQQFDLRTNLWNLRFDTDREWIKGFSLAYVEHGNIHWWKTQEANEMTSWLNWGTRNRYEVNVWRNLWLTGAIDAAIEGGHSSARGRYQLFAPYFGARYDFELNDDWTLTPSAGGKYYYHSDFDNAFAPEGSITLSYQENLDFYVNGSRQMHYPGIFTKAPAFRVNNDLKAEKMDYVSVGSKLTLSKSLEFNTDVYHMEIKDRIENVKMQYLNTGYLNANGWESSLRYRPVDDVVIFGGLAYAYSPHRATRLPKWSASAGVTWKLGDHLEWTVDGQYLGKTYAYSNRQAAAVNSAELVKDAAVFNTRVEIPFEPITFFVAVENFTNQKYAYYPGYPVPGTMFYVGGKLKF